VFGKSKPVVIDSYGSRKAKKRLPRWLLLLLLGLAAGIGGTIYVQEQVLPRRLSASDSAALRDALGAAEADRAGLRTELAATTGRLDVAQAETQRLGAELAANKQAVARSRDDVEFLVAALPADPRGGAVEIRAARFRASRGALDYEVALAASRGRTAAAVVELVVSGDGGRAGQGPVTLDPVPLPATSNSVLRGRAALPEGFMPQQCMIRVLDRPGGQLLGMRLLNVR